MGKEAAKKAGEEAIRTFEVFFHVRQVVRSGIFGLATDWGSGADCIAKATDNMITEFATTLQGTPQSVIDGELRNHVRDIIHMVTVDSASDEVCHCS